MGSDEKNDGIISNATFILLGKNIGYKVMQMLKYVIAYKVTLIKLCVYLLQQE